MIREGVTGAEVHHIEDRIEGGGTPKRRSTGKVRVTGPRAGLGGVETPEEFPCRRVVGVQMTAHRFIPARNANKHFWHCPLTSANELRSKGNGSAVVGEVDGCFP